MKLACSIIAPSGKVSNDNWLLSQRELETLIDMELFFEPEEHFHRFSATDQIRIENYLRANHSYAEIVWCARGGYGLSRIIEHLPPPTKIIAGFSDITILHALNWSTTELPSYHSLMPISFHKYDQESKDLTISLFQNQEITWKFQTHKEQNQKLSGRLIGGNLSVLYGLLGTPYFQVQEGDVLFIEDLGENHYHIDRMLWAFKHAGIFDKIKGLLVGQFSDFLDQNDLGITFEELFTEKLGSSTPSIFGLPCGHEFINYPLIFNRNIEINAVDKEIQINQKI